LRSASAMTVSAVPSWCGVAAGFGAGGLAQPPSSPAAASPNATRPPERLEFLQFIFDTLSL